MTSTPTEGAWAPRQPSTPGSAGWARWPDPEADPAGTVVLEAFGEPAGATPGPAGEEDLYSVFLAHAEMMGWSALSSPDGRGGLWGMNDAALTADGGERRIGWVQVGLAHRVELPDAVPPLVCCFVAALARLGARELTALRVTATELPPTAMEAARLWQALNWFNAARRAPCEIGIGVDRGPAAACAEDLLEYLPDLSIEPFGFGSAVPPAAHDRPSGPEAAPVMITARLPEATITAVGWALAMVIHAAGQGRPPAEVLTVGADLANGGGGAGWSLTGE